MQHISITISPISIGAEIRLER